MHPPLCFELHTDVLDEMLLLDPVLLTPHPLQPPSYQWHSRYGVQPAGCLHITHMACQGLVAQSWPACHVAAVAALGGAEQRYVSKPSFILRCFENCYMNTFMPTCTLVTAECFVKLSLTFTVACPPGEQSCISTLQYMLLEARQLPLLPEHPGNLQMQVNVQLVCK